jgi:hypothetical protein
MFVVTLVLPVTLALCMRGIVYICAGWLLLSSLRGEEEWWARRTRASRERALERVPIERKSAAASATSAVQQRAHRPRRPRRGALGGRLDDERAEARRDALRGLVVLAPRRAVLGPRTLTTRVRSLLGSLVKLQWGVACAGAPLSAAMLFAAAAGLGELRMLSWLRACSCPWSR